MITGEMYEDIRDTLKGFGLPVALTQIALDAREIVNTTRLDKKMEAGTIKFILLNPAGRAVIDKTVDDAQMLAAARCIGAE